MIALQFLFPDSIFVVRIKSVFLTESAQMQELLKILDEVERGDQLAAGALLPLVYGELRKLAAALIALEDPGHTLQATAVVHEAYLRLIRHQDNAPRWQGEAHFFAAAASEMRRILVDSARRKQRLRHGKEFVKHDINAIDRSSPEEDVDILALDEALSRLQSVDAEAATLVQLRYFAGLTIPEAAQVLKISPRSTDRLWAFARSWLKQELEDH